MAGWLLRRPDGGGRARLRPVDPYVELSGLECWWQPQRQRSRDKHLLWYADNTLRKQARIRSPSQDGLRVLSGLPVGLILGVRTTQRRSLRRVLAARLRGFTCGAARRWLSLMCNTRLFTGCLATFLVRADRFDCRYTSHTACRCALHAGRRVDIEPYHVASREASGKKTSRPEARNLRASFLVHRRRSGRSRDKIILGRCAERADGSDPGVAPAERFLVVHSVP